MDSRKDAAYEDLMPIGRKKGSSPPGASSSSRVAILLEDIQSKVQLTMEAVTGLRAEFRSEIELLRTQLSRRIDVLELAVRQNSLDIRKNSEDISQLKTEVRQNTKDIQELRAAVDQNTKDIRELRADVGQNSKDIRKLTDEIRSMREQLERKADHEALLKLQTRVEALERRLGIQ